MHFEVLVEDQSGKKALDILFPKIIDAQHTFKVIAYRGIGHIPQNLKRDGPQSARKSRYGRHTSPHTWRSPPTHRLVSATFGRKFRNLLEAQRVLLPVSTNHTVCSMILKSSLSDMFSM